MRWAVGFVFLGFVGCSSQQQGTPIQDNGGAPSIALEPSDLSTDHDAQSVQISAKNTFHAPATLTTEDLTLREQSSGDVVPVTLDDQPDPTNSIQALFSVHPTMPLEPGWYALVVQGDSESIFPNTHARADGAFETRFRIGSEPLLLGIRACGKSDGSVAVILDFSEHVTLPSGGPSVEVFVGGSPATCTLDSSPQVVDFLSLHCSPLGSASTATSVEVGTGIASSSSGLLLATSQSSLPRTFDLATKPENDGCHHWRESATPVD